MMRRIVTLVVVALVMAAMMLTVAFPAMAQRICPAGSRPQVLFVTPGPDAVVLFDCVPVGQPDQPPA